MTPAGTTVWRNDVVFDARELHRDDPHSLVCFLISPFSPKQDFDQVLDAVKFACAMCEKSMGVRIKCVRADSFHESKTIHDDIWHNIAKADVLVVDVTNLNPNVMLEYGVAAALRRPSQVIVIKSAEDKSDYPFDVKPLRYLLYSRTILPIITANSFINNLYSCMLEALAPAPYVPPSADRSANGFSAALHKGDKPDLILSPGITHRRIIHDGLEFGSFYVYQKSWLHLTSSDYHNVRARIQFRFQELFTDGLQENQYPFIGLALRSQHVYANWGGFMVCVGSEGHVWRTEPHDENGKYEDVSVGHLKDYDWRKSGPIQLEVSIDERRLAFSVSTVSGDGNSVAQEILVKHMPYVYGAGKVRVQTSRCRVVIQEIELKPLPSSQQVRRKRETS